MGVCPSGLRGLTQDQVDAVLVSSNLTAPTSFDLEIVKFNNIDMINLMYD